MGHEFFRLTIKSIIKETTDAVSLTFNIPKDLRENFRGEAGQYLNLRFHIGDEEYRRSYSLCSVPELEDPKVTIKRVKGGNISNYINDHLKAGDEVDVMAPEGRFTIAWNPESERDYFFIAAGSGITPIMSLIKTGLEIEPKSNFYLMFGNRSMDDIIFRSELDGMTKRYNGQFHMVHCLSALQKPILKRFFGKGESSDKIWEGRINGKKIQRFVELFSKGGQKAKFLLCGPGGMIETASHQLQKIGISKGDIHAEYFSTDKASSADESHFKEANVEASLDGEQYNFKVRKGKTILETLISEGADPPYSCTSGVCSTCAAKLLKGSVEMDVCLALDEREIEEGLILTCQAHPTTAEVRLTYDI